jgi:hypothetical protein
METNVNEFDGAARTLIFIIAVVYAIMTGHWIWVIPGAILFATALLTWCPLCAILGIWHHEKSTGQ